MPIYDYHCRQCGGEFTLLRPMREADAAATCPRCGATDARRRPSLVARRAAACPPTGG